MSFGWALEKQSLDLLGYSSPIPLADRRLARDVAKKFADPEGYVKNPHSQSREIAALLRDANFVRVIKNFVGAPTIIWRSALFKKVAGSDEIGWHHDKHFYTEGEDTIHLNEIGAHYSVLFALTDITDSMGMLEVLPGTHRETPDLKRDPRPFDKRAYEEHFLDIPESLSSQRRAVPLPAGSFLVFHSALLHRSLEHTGSAPRLGLAIRMCKPGISVPENFASREELREFSPEELV